MPDNPTPRSDDSFHIMHLADFNSFALNSGLYLPGPTLIMCHLPCSYQKAHVTSIKQWLVKGPITANLKKYLLLKDGTYFILRK